MKWSRCDRHFRNVIGYYVRHIKERKRSFKEYKGDEIVDLGQHKCRLVEVIPTLQSYN